MRGGILYKIFFLKFKIFGGDFDKIGPALMVRKKKENNCYPVTN
jgi:hypothetical protein